MSTKIRWDPPKGYEGTHAEAVALAMERQLMACENDTVPCPHWAQLSQHERDIAVLDAANYLTALRRITTATEPATTDVDEIRARWTGRDPGLLTIVDHAVTDVRALLAERDLLLRSLRELYSAARPDPVGDDLDDLLDDGENEVDFMAAFIAQTLRSAGRDARDG